MTGIWHDEGNRLVPLPAQPYANEQALHNSIERAPAMLPLPGQPRLVILGREVQLGNGYADLVAVDADSGRPVVIEVKLAANSDRRTVFAQVLGYASYIFRLSATAFEELMQPHVTERGHATVADAVAAEVGDGSFDIETFRNGMAEEFEKGNVRCVVVLDAAPTDLIELAGYLQTVTNDRLDIDLVTVMAYDVRGSRVLVPQLVEPERALAASVSPSRIQREARPTSGSASFRDSIDSADPPIASCSAGCVTGQSDCSQTIWPPSSPPWARAAGSSIRVFPVRAVGCSRSGTTEAPMSARSALSSKPRRRTHLLSWTNGFPARSVRTTT